MVFGLFSNKNKLLNVFFTKNIQYTPASPTDPRTYPSELYGYTTQVDRTSKINIDNSPQNPYVELFAKNKSSNWNNPIRFLIVPFKKDANMIVKILKNKLYDINTGIMTNGLNSPEFKMDKKYTEIYNLLFVKLGLGNKNVGGTNKHKTQIKRVRRHRNSKTLKKRKRNHTI
jgi:hypothetical protein